MKIFFDYGDIYNQKMEFNNIYLSLVISVPQVLLYHCGISILDITLLLILSTIITLMMTMNTISKIPSPMNELELIDEMVRDIYKYITLNFVILSLIVMYYTVN